uniref:Uncharacterized protein AlNc14C1G146 n=1 Tax=Albugo laibachii Nc14 TaxID=890382 RepID=F0VYZ9_9STRA|nr:conserved hypothetical protein [Albugo laibachii Nc14]|eukprot:CCA14014.1 conserved hypothetical protein [Albugo laibachii Nc14]
MRSLCCFRRHQRDSMGKRYREQLDKVKDVFPGTSYVCLLDGENGNVIAQSEETNPNTEEFARFVRMLRKAAMQFAETLNQMDSQILHIKGDDTMFSCYGLDRTVLAFYSQLPDVEMELFDYTEADKNLETINLELDKLVRDVKTSARRRK